MVLRKIWHKRGLMASLLIGMLLAGALVALIPTYARMSLNRTFQKELEGYQQETGVYPGMALATAFYNENEAIDTLSELEQKKQPALSDARIIALLDKRRENIVALDEQLATLDKQIGLPEQVRVDNLTSTGMQMSIEKSRGTISKTGKLQSLTGLAENMTLLRGELPKAPQGEVYEALATEEALLFFDAEVGDEIACAPRLDLSVQPIRVKIVGTFDVDPEKSLAWGFFKPIMFRDSLLLREEDANALLLGTPVLAASVRRYIAYDYRQMLSAGLSGYTGLAKELNKALKPYGATFDIPVLQKAASFLAQEKSLKTTLWMLNIPVLIMLALYMAMVSGMVIDNDTGEIALLVSRGGGGGLLFRIYLTLGLVLSLGALLLGPPLAQVLTRILGSVNGFLSFVQRGVPKAQLNIESYLYCAAALLIAVFMLALPAVKRRGVSIVEQKRDTGVTKKRPLYQTLCLDILLLIATIGAWYLLKTHPEWAASASGELNPAIFALMPCFAVGATLCFLRIYPLLIKLVYALGSRFWRADAYLALLRVARNTGSYRYIMVFLSLTMAVGVFSASAARTLNDNATDRLHYSLGADVTLTVNWPRQGAQEVKIGQNGAQPAATADAGGKTRRFQEPLFTPYRELAGVQSAARVFQRDAVNVAGTQTAGNVHLMAIDPADFGRTAWYRSDLWSAHFYSYLNALSQDERACLISSSLAKQLNARMGDWVTLGWDGSDNDSFYVAGIVGYWPGWDPYAMPLLAVADLTAVQDLLAVEPYGVWLKMKGGASAQALYDDMAQKGIRPTFLRNFEQENIGLVNGSTRLSVNGVMTLGFIASCIVCALGFTLYWQMYLRRNQLQLGLQRGMGLTAGQLMRMLLIEQTLTCLVALIVGVLIGMAGSLLYVPLFEYSLSAKQAPPFRVRMLASDRLVIYGIILGMLALCWCYLGVKMKRMKVAQAIKLGED
jgi:putative ABC transport system permease protein